MPESYSGWLPGEKWRLRKSAYQAELSPTLRPRRNRAMQDSRPPRGYNDAPVKNGQPHVMRSVLQFCYPISYSPAASHQADYGHDDGNHEKEVNETSCHVEPPAE